TPAPATPAPAPQPTAAPAATEVPVYVAPADQTSSPKTGNNADWLYVVGMMGMLAMISGVSYRCFKKKENE
ncbi:MAG: LPXTG cell wall anchor domain-containing protein, partial [Lachnospiraceae bacterium]|nr:LPXTG cell wall anchor domain-containing protein [Lachnospiraceae bacterium]